MFSIITRKENQGLNDELSSNSPCLVLLQKEKLEHIHLFGSNSPCLVLLPQENNVFIAIFLHLFEIYLAYKSLK